MIRILDRYIAKTVMLATALVALVIAGVLFLMLLLAQLKNIGEGDYGIIQAFLYVTQRMPGEFYQFSPMIILLGTLIGLSILSSHRELAVMRTAGFSTRRLIYSALGAACLLIIAMIFLGEWIAPNLSYKAEVRKENAQNAGQAVVTAAGVWFHVDNNFIHVEHVIGRQLLEGVTWYQFNNKHQLQAAYFAKTLSLHDKQWQMNEVVKTTFYANGTNEMNEARSETFSEAKWNLKLNPSLLNIGLVDPNEMSLPKLNKFARYLEQNGLQASAYEYEFWQRVFQPFAALIMVFVALPFVLSSLNMTTLGVRIILGILMGFAFFIANAFLGQLSIVFQLPAMLAAFFPLFLFIILGFFLLKYVRLP